MIFLFPRNIIIIILTVIVYILTDNEDHNRLELALIDQKNSTVLPRYLYTSVLILLCSKKVQRNQEVINWTVGRLWREIKQIHKH